MMITQNLLFLFTCSPSLFILFLSLFHFFQTSLASSSANPYCTPSACGLIRNISYPFRLKGDPKNCGNILYELVCEDNTTSVYLNFGSQKYDVKAINYNNLTIRLAHVSINMNNICSFPDQSLYQINFIDLDYPYSVYTDKVKKVSHEVAWPINIISCRFPLANAPLLRDANICAGEASRLSSDIGRYTYVKVGHAPVSDLKYTCQVDLSTLTSWKFKDFNNVSALSEVHDSLMYGFELSWFDFNLDFVQTVRHYTWYYFRMIYLAGSNSVVAILILILLLILGLSLAATSFIGLFVICAPILVFLINKKWLGYYAISWFIFYPPVVVVIGYAARFIFGIAFIMWVLIYKFRRRHLSMFDAIEGFLQSDNNIMPIRYSYSNIKRMTKGFRHKLGEGGYGSVYKGKLRSGNDVAVKLLGKSGANGQDFMNEIATIGRIHHVNVVKLVGYCVERSKRALVFDFMPNGSLEKYLFNREKMNSLNWDTKFEIAVGVARGIEYLHRGCDIQILHFDIKPHNILLDSNFVPKISDFGLAKFLSTEKTSVSLTMARGTIGYVAPELINRSIGLVSNKADVYSYGMLLIEIVGLKRNLIGNNQDSSKYFPYWIYDCFTQGKEIDIESCDENGDSDTRKVGRKMIIVALWCIQMNPDDRPSMHKVMEMLEADVERLQIPEYPSQATQIEVNVDQTCSTTDYISSPYHDDDSSRVEITVLE